ncbi:hypothetical protein ACFQQB_63985 [Nonomuraea rubra]|uniref:hypothetical protein n=1 Tax=Nonomuraea rubra TaxID=46180 RepID=UPI003623C078
MSTVWAVSGGTTAMRVVTRSPRASAMVKGSAATISWTAWWACSSFRPTVPPYSRRPGRRRHQPRQECAITPPFRPGSPRR